MHAHVAVFCQDTSGTSHAAAKKKSKLLQEEESVEAGYKQGEDDRDQISNMHQKCHELYHHISGLVLAVMERILERSFHTAQNADKKRVVVNTGWVRA